ncbi:MAG: SUMF1/EgtB/PvdO family nonheme iron enzyme, partial [Gammaproteobacteria bacterium]
SLQIFKSGYEGVSRRVTASAQAEQTVSVRLTPLLGEIQFAANPSDAELYVDGILMGRADRTLSLPSMPHEVEIRKSGYAPYSTSVIPRPGFIQQVTVRLLTEAEARRLAIPVEVAWDEAARYCNWLSRREKLPLAYIEENGAIVGFDPQATGYRLPTEAEWAWSARHVEGAPLLKFPWGDSMPPSERVGNFADRTAAHLIGRIIFNYTDGHVVSAPVGTFPRNQNGLNDLGGNVAEWVHDFYEIPPGDPSTDPVGPDEGEYHVIRGSSWMHGTVTDLRYSFRDYGIDGRKDLGFRLARYAE